MLHRLNPVPAVRHLRARGGSVGCEPPLPRLAEYLLDRIDADLEAVPALDELTSRQLVALLHRSRAILRSLHAHEILMGMLTDTGDNRMTGASVALRVLVEARQDGLDDTEILVRSLPCSRSPARRSPPPVLPEEALALTSPPPRDSGATTTGSSARRCDCACAGCRSCRGAPRGSSESGWPPPISLTEPSRSVT